MDCRSTMRPAVAALLLVTFAGDTLPESSINLPRFSERRVVLPNKGWRPGPCAHPPNAPSLHSLFAHLSCSFRIDALLVAGTSFAQNEILQRPCTSKDNCFAQWGYITSQIKFQEELSPELNCRCNHGDISKCPKSVSFAEPRTDPAIPGHHHSQPSQHALSQQSL